jgi:hypothetical protein
MMFYHGVVCERERAGKKLLAFSRRNAKWRFSGELNLWPIGILKCQLDLTGK